MSKYPEGWYRVRLSSVMEKIARPVDVQPNELYKQIGIRSHGKGIFHKAAVTGQEIGDKRIFWVEPGDFVLNIVFAWEGAVALVSENELGRCASHRFPTYAVDQSTCHPEYLLRYFQTPRGIEQLGLASPGGAGRNRTLNQSELLNLAIPLPPLPEQRKIAEILSTWDDAIATVDALIAALQRRKRGLMQRLLTGQVRFAEFEGSEWQSTHLAKVANVTMGQSPSSANYNEDGIGLPLVQGNADIHNKRTDPRVYTTEITRQCQVGDIILSVRAPVGETALAVHNAVIGRGVCAIRATTVNQSFLFHLLTSLETRWLQFAQGSTFTAINSSDIRSLDLSFPADTKEQNRIAETLDLADKQVRLLVDQRLKFVQQKKGLMQRLLTGQVRVEV